MFYLSNECVYLSTIDYQFQLKHNNQTTSTKADKKIKVKKRSNVSITPKQNPNG